MRIRYTLHALERIKQRGIEREAVEECLRNPDKVISLNNVFQCVKKVEKDKVLIVVYRKLDEMLLVITAYISAKIHKYL